MTTDALRHPKEEAALAALIRSRPVQMMLETFHTVYHEATSFAELRNRNFLVTDDTNPRLSRLFRTAKRRLGMAEEIPLYVAMEYVGEAKILGTDGDCAIVLDSTCMEQYTDDQLLAVLGRAICHIQCGHVKYLNLGNLSDKILGRIPLLGTAAAQTAKALLLSWREYAEYTADRGAAVAANDAEPAIETLLYGMGAFPSGTDGTSWVIQAPDYRETAPGREMTAIGKIIFQMLMNMVPVPFGNLRVVELRRWSESDTCLRKFPQVHYGSLSRANKTAADADRYFQQAQQSVRKNETLRLELLHLAAKLGQADALAELGRRYLLGDDCLPQNAALGLEWLRASALLGNRDGLYGLGLCVLHGYPPMLQANEKMAVRMLRSAASRGQQQADIWLRTHPQKQGFLRPDVAEKLLNWFSRNYSPGRCFVYGEGDCTAPYQLWDSLWIPLDEPVYAVEQDGANTAAFCGTGLYFYSGAGLPGYLTWWDLQQGELEASEPEGWLYWNGQEICHYAGQGSERRIALLVIQMKRLLIKRWENTYGTQ